MYPIDQHLSWSCWQFSRKTGCNSKGRDAMCWWMLTTLFDHRHFYTLTYHEVGVYACIGLRRKGEVQRMVITYYKCMLISHNRRLSVKQMAFLSLNILSINIYPPRVKDGRTADIAIMKIDGDNTHSVTRHSTTKKKKWNTRQMFHFAGWARLTKEKNFQEPVEVRAIILEVVFWYDAYMF